MLGGGRAPEGVIQQTDLVGERGVAGPPIRRALEPLEIARGGGRVEASWAPAVMVYDDRGRLKGLARVADIFDRAPGVAGVRQQARLDTDDERIRPCPGVTEATSEVRHGGPLRGQTPDVFPPFFVQGLVVV